LVNVPPFEPVVRQPDLLTILGNFWPRPGDPARFPVRDWLLDTEPGVRVRIHSQTPRPVSGGPAPGAELLLVHGLEGSSEAGYLRSLAHAALERGFATHRFNIRGCGGTEHLANTLYHSGLTVDVRRVAERIREETGRPVFLAGFSLGGNVALKLAGELGETDLLRGVAAVSTPIDLLACVRRLGERRNWLYEQRFVRRMKKRLQERHRLMPERFPLDGLDGIRTVYEFDDRITAPHFGFDNAEHYYTTQSANRYLDRIAIPALLVQAADDPMIPCEVYRHPAIAANRHIESLTTEHGGHIGFIARRGPRFWLDPVIVAWMERVLGQTGTAREQVTSGIRLSE
jgi:predicted alpha/beta-fold hydrolase